MNFYAEKEYALVIAPSGQVDAMRRRIAAALSDFKEIFRATSFLEAGIRLELMDSCTLIFISASYSAAAVREFVNRTKGTKVCAQALYVLARSSTREVAAAPDESYGTDGVASFSDSFDAIETIKGFSIAAREKRLAARQESAMAALVDCICEQLDVIAAVSAKGGQASLSKAVLREMCQELRTFEDNLESAYCRALIERVSDSQPPADSKAAKGSTPTERAKKHTRPKTTSRITRSAA